MSTLSSKVDYRNIYRSFPDMCLSLETSTGKIISFNQTLLEVLGYSKEEVENATLYDLYAASEIEKVKDNLESIKESRIPKNTEFIVRKKNGELLDVSLKLSFVRDGDGNVLYSNAVWRDISALKKVQRALKKEKKKTEDQNALILEQNKNLLDSIRYAQGIQQGMLPTVAEISTHFPSSFIYYQPKDLVSGDFYWLYEKEDTVLFAVVDCTGHGVPGALMSMAGNALFDQVAAIQEQVCAELIMNKIRAGIIKALKQGLEDSTNSDGMDAGLCVYNKSNKILEFSGANNTLLIVRSSQDVLLNSTGTAIEAQLTNETHSLYEIKGQRQPLGYFMGMGILFEKQMLQLQQGDRLYLFSDGFQDQIGGVKNKKYLYKRFKSDVLGLVNTPINNQLQYLKDKHVNWKGSINDQTDDICIWGIEI